MRRAIVRPAAYAFGRIYPRQPISTTETCSSRPIAALRARNLVWIDDPYLAGTLLQWIVNGQRRPGRQPTLGSWPSCVGPKDDHRHNPRYTPRCSRQIDGLPDHTSAAARIVRATARIGAATGALGCSSTCMS